MEEWAAYCLKWAEKKVVTHNRGFEVGVKFAHMKHLFPKGDKPLSEENRVGDARFAIRFFNFLYFECPPDLAPVYVYAAKNKGTTVSETEGLLSALKMGLRTATGDTALLRLVEGSDNVFFISCVLVSLFVDF